MAANGDIKGNCRPFKGILKQHLPADIRTNVDRL
jgi:hypothetical protein